MGYRKWVKLSPKVYNIGYNKNKSDNYDPNINVTRAQNLLPVMYQGPSNRLDRYNVYENMEQDPVIASSLDILSDYISNIEDGNVFKINYVSQDVPTSQVDILNNLLKQWENGNQFKKRIFNLTRDCLKYGDIFFIRDPDTGYLLKVNPYDVVGCVVGDLKEVKWWLIRNIDVNAPLKIAFDARNDVEGQNAIRSFNTLNAPITANSTKTQNVNTNNVYGIGGDLNRLTAIKAEHVVHITLNIDNAVQYPFGVSILENIYKLYIQKILLQDCVIMLRLKNAPDRLIFKIPVGNVPRMMRRSYMERCRNEITQRRMPSKTSDGVFNTVDVSYNAMAMNEDFWFPVDSNQVQPAVEKLQGSNNLGELTDLNYWDLQIIRGVHVPQAWQNYGTTDSQRTLPTTTAATLVQEDRFYRYCDRHKNIMSEPYSEEFKKFVKDKGYNFDFEGFFLEFNESSQINKMTELDIHQRELSNYSQAVQVPGMSVRFAMKKYLGFTDEEYQKNREMYMEENPDKLKSKDIKIPQVNNKQVPGLRSISATDIDDSALQAIEDVFADERNGGKSGGGLGGGLGGGMDMGAGLGAGEDMGSDVGAEMGAESAPNE